MNRQHQIQSELSALLSLPCPDATSQEVHDKLVLFDTLYAEGHTKECGVGMVWGNRGCMCGKVQSTGLRPKGESVMAKYRKKPVVIEAMTFDEMVEYGKANGGNVVDGMPWSFHINGHAVSHENDELYLITTLEGTHNMTRSDMLIIGVQGEIYPCKLDIFGATYEPA